MSGGELDPITEGVLATAEDGIAVLADGVFRRVTDGYCGTFGIEDRETIEGRDRAHRYDEAAERRLATEVSRLSAGEQWRGDVDGVDADGNAVPLDLTVRRVDETHTVHVVRPRHAPDVPESGNGESGRRYRRLVETAPVPIGVFTADREVVYCNERAVEFLGADDRDEILGRDPAEFVHEADRERTLERIEQVLEDREPTSPAEQRFRTLDGDERVAVVATAPVTYGGEPAAQVVFDDVTARAARERDLARYEAIVETMGDGAMIIDADGTFTLVNHRVHDLIEPPDDGFVGTPVTEILPDLATDDGAVAEFGRLFQELREGDRDRGRMELALETKKGEMHLDVRLAPVIVDGDVDGIVATTRDVTERERRERELRESERRYRRLVETAPVPIVTLDGGADIVYANEAAAELTGVEEPEGLVGRSALEFVHPAERDRARDRVRRVIEDRETPDRVERRLLGPDGEKRHAIIAVTPIVYDDEPAAQIVLNDVTELKRRERQLAAQNAKIERLHEVATDLDGCSSPADVYELVVATAEDILDADRIVAYAAEADTLVAATASHGSAEESDGVSIDADDIAARAYRTGEPSVLDRKGAGTAADDAGSPGSSLSVPVADYGVVRADATDSDAFDETDLELVELLVAHAQAALTRIDRERELQRERDRLELLVEHLPTPVMYGPTSPEGPIVETVNPAFEEVFGCEAEDVTGEQLDELIVPDDVDNEEINRRAVEDGSVAAEVRRMTADGVRDFHLQTAIVSRDAPDDDYPYEGWAIYTDITEQKRRERELRHQRDELETLNRINELVLRITRSLVDRPSRDDVETTVCDSIVDSELYDLACVVEPTLGDEELAVRAVRGTDAAGPERIPVDPDGPRSSALTTGEIVVSSDSTSPPWDDRPYASMAVVPLIHQETLQGLLEIHTDREDAFSDRERAGFRTLAETMGFVVNAIENRKLLVADSVIELELAADDTLIASLSAAHECSLSLEGYVDAGTNDWLVYLAVADADAEAVAAAVRDRDTVESARVVADHRRTEVVELTVEEGLFPVDVLEHGVKVSEARATGGDARFTVEAPLSADVRDVLGRIQSEYPETTLLSRRERGRTVRTAADLWDRIEDRLTDRQLAALKTAFHAGYFAWPRESTAEEVADAMGISSPTLHNHLRRAQRQLLEVLLASEDEETVTLA